MGLSALGQVTSNSLAKEVTNLLREAIVRGNLHPGERLSEPIVSKQLQVSRSPVREALNHLIQEGLVTRQSNRSCYVWKPAPADVDEIFSLRVIIESLAAEWTIEKLTDDDFAHLEELIAKQQQVIAEREFLAIIQVDKQFHEYFFLRSQHSRLIAWWRQIASQWEVLTYLRTRASSEMVLQLPVPDHQAILVAFRQRDLRQVQELHRTINRGVSEHIKTLLQTNMNDTI